MSYSTGFNAMGKSVPVNRLMRGYKTVQEILPDITKAKAYSIVAKCANIIERDEPFRIVGAVEGLDKDLDAIDLIGRYRLLSVLLTDAS